MKRLSPLSRLSLLWVMVAITLVPWWPCCCSQAPQRPPTSDVHSCCQAPPTMAEACGGSHNELTCQCRVPDLGLSELPSWIPLDFVATLPPEAPRLAPADLVFRKALSACWGLPPPPPFFNLCASRAPPLG